MKKILVCGAGGFLGNHLVRFLKSKDYYVTGVDINKPKFSNSQANVFKLGDLRDNSFVKSLFQEPFDEVYQMAADMGGAGYIFTGEKDADLMYNAAMMNLNILRHSAVNGVKKIFYPSSACVYPESCGRSKDKSDYAELDAYPASPGSEYGWEKLFSERLYAAHMRNYGITVKIARFHTIIGPEVVYSGGKEKAPAAIARKVIEAKDCDEIEIWGDGLQTRSFLYVDECLKGIDKLMRSEDFHGPVNIGSDEEISINELAEVYIEFSGKTLSLKHIDGPIGMRGRISNNDLISKKLNWKPTESTKEGLKKLYMWIEEQISNY